jgi:hypothetical protein
MEILLPLSLIIATIIYEPGNVKINNFCREAVSVGIYETRKECWDEYHEYRDEIPEL